MEGQPSKLAGDKPPGGAGKWVTALLVVFVTLAAFIPTFQSEFVNFDDLTNLVANEHYRGLGLSHLRWMWTTRLGGVWQPVSWMFAGAQALVLEPTAVVFHTVSLALHIGNCLLVYAIAVRLLRSTLAWSGATTEAGLRAGAAVTSLVFGVHPLRAEVVAWASCQPYVLAGAFSLLCVLAFLRAGGADNRGKGSKLWYALSLLCAALAMLSKSAAVVLPVVLVVLDVYPLRRIGRPAGWLSPQSRQVWLEKVPFLALSVVVSVLAVWATRWAPPGVSLAERGLGGRIAVIALGFAFPLFKSLFPTGLFALYEVPERIRLFEARYLLSGLLVVGVSGLLVAVRRRWPGGLAAWVCYLVFLVPVARIVEHGASVSADRYSYLSCVGPSVLLGGGVLVLWHRISASRRLRVMIGPIAVCAGAGVVALAALTWRQVGVWHDSQTFWEHALALKPDSAIAHNNLGRHLQDRSDLEGAIRQYRAALQVDPDHANAHANLTNVLRLKGRAEEAIAHGLEAIRLLPDMAAAHYNLSLAYLAAGRFAEAEQSAREAASRAPKLAVASEALGAALLGQGRVREAIDEHRRAVRLDPEYAAGYTSLGVALAVGGRKEEAAAAWETAIRLDPDEVNAHFNLAKLRASQGRKAEAISHLCEVLRVAPDSRGAQEGLRALLGE